MSESIHRFITAGYAVSIDFTKQGRRQFAKVNRSLGRELRYDDGICLLLRKEHGQWLITEVFRTEEASAFAPVYIWTQLRRGCSFILTRLLIGWRCLTKSAAERLVRA